MANRGGPTGRRVWGRVATLLTGRPEAPHGWDYAANVMHVDRDAICPRCLRWIGSDDIVRRTAYGPVQHESCPVVPSLVRRS